MEIPKENVEDLKCSNCNKYLSYFPIKLTNDNKSICGRCSGKITDDNALHVTTYELLAQFMRFPCSFDGCYSTLLPSEVQQHEITCPYRQIHCLLQENCDFYGKNDEFYQHCLEVHPTLILKNSEFEVDLTGSYEQNNLLQNKDRYFIVNRKFDKITNLLSCSITTIDDNSNCNYQIIMQNGKRDISCDFELKAVKNYLTKENIPTEIKIVDVQEKLSHPSVMIATINIIDNEQNELDNRLDYERLSDLECPVCCHYMMPPIKLCETGHSICSECMEQLDKCPLCRLSFKTNQRNISLERIAHRSNFPCRNMDSGCIFVANLDGIKQHQEFCKYTRKKCLLNDYVVCNWIGLDDDLPAHIANEHHDNNIYNNQIDTYINENFYNEEFNGCYIVNFFGRLFKLHHLYKNHRFYWTMQVNGWVEKHQCFKYEIDFIDNNGNDQKMVFRDLCTPITKKNECFQQGSRFIIVETSQITRFIADNTLSYRIRIINY